MFDLYYEMKILTKSEIGYKCLIRIKEQPKTSNIHEFNDYQISLLSYIE
jgi:hypothetical protein